MLEYDSWAGGHHIACNAYCNRGVVTGEWGNATRAKRRCWRIVAGGVEDAIGFVG